MKLLLDENLSATLKKDLFDHEVTTVVEGGWQGIRNGNLLHLMIAYEFDALITLDRHFRYQQNFEKHPIPVIILKAGDNSPVHLRRLMPQLNKLLRRLKPGPHELILNLN